MKAFYKHVTKAESRKQRRNLPAMQQSHKSVWCAALQIPHQFPKRYGPNSS